MKSLQDDDARTIHNSQGVSVLRQHSFSRFFIYLVFLLIVVFVLTACGSKAKTASVAASTTTQSTVADTPVPATTAQLGLTCNADKSSDSIDPGKYFGNILAGVRKIWHSDAVISSVRFEQYYDNNFGKLCALKTDSDWQVIFYSLSSKTEISTYLDNSQKDSAGVPSMKFHYTRPDQSTDADLTPTDAKKQGNWVLYEFSRPETYSHESKYAANLFLGWKMSMSDVVQKLIDRVRDEKITGRGYALYLGKASLKTRTPYVDIFWQNGDNRNAFYVEPISVTTYNSKY